MGRLISCFGLALPFAGAQSGLLIYLLVDRRTSEILKRLVLDELCELNGYTTSFREVLMSTFIIQKGEARIGNAGILISRPPAAIDPDPFSR